MLSNQYQLSWFAEILIRFIMNHSYQIHHLISFARKKGRFNGIFVVKTMQWSDKGINVKCFRCFLEMMKSVIFFFEFFFFIQNVKICHSVPLSNVYKLNNSYERFKATKLLHKPKLKCEPSEVYDFGGCRLLFGVRECVFLSMGYSNSCLFVSSIFPLVRLFFSSVVYLLMFMSFEFRFRQ